MLSFENVSFSYDEIDSILSGVSFTVEEGEFVALVGPSGCGKSTILRLVSGLLEKQTGTISHGSDLNCTFVFQDAALMPWATVSENIALPLKLKGNQNKRAVTEVLRLMEMDGFEARYPASLSGGQKMRVSIARALISNPSLLLLDEPFAALDEILRFQMNNLLLSLRKNKVFSSLFVTHSIYEAAYLADRVIVLKGGELVGQVLPKLDRTIPEDRQRTSEGFMESSRQIAKLLSGDVS